MTWTDEWYEKLRCPNCGKTGTAGLSQSDDAVLTVHNVPGGFKVVTTLHGPNFHCVTCNVAVVP